MKVLVVGDKDSIDKQKRIVEILDKKYEPIVVEKKNNIGRFYSQILAMGVIFDSFSDNPIKTRSRPSVDIAQEFELIQQKKSKLSRSDREWVVYQFHKHFKEVE